MSETEKIEYIEQLLEEVYMDRKEVTVTEEYVLPEQSHRKRGLDVSKADTQEISE